MRKKTQNYILFVILFFLGLFQAVSGFIMWLALPHGGGLSRNTWIDLHDWVAVSRLGSGITTGYDYHTPYLTLEMDCLYDKILF